MATMQPEAGKLASELREARELIGLVAGKLLREFNDTGTVEPNVRVRGMFQSLLMAAERFVEALPEQFMRTFRRVWDGNAVPFGDVSRSLKALSEALPSV